MATGTVILTGANSSLGIRTAEFILKNHPRVTAVFTVRDGGDGDVNTRELRDIVKSYPDTKANIHALDLADLSKVHAFTDEITAAISEGRLPALTAVICNAFYWNLLKGPELTVDGFDKTIQIGHIAHVALVLRLVGQFESHTGRVVLLSSSTHFAAPSPLETYPKEIPQDLTDLINPPNPTFNDEQGRGFQRYGNTKLVITTWMHAFNHHLQADASLRNVTALAVDPGTLGDSRAWQTNVPGSLMNLSRFLFRPLAQFPFIAKFVDKSIRSTQTAAADVVELALGQAHRGAQGFYKFSKEAQSDPISNDKSNQNRIWKESATWAGVGANETALAL